jgi:hypothetical protein
MSRFSDGYGRWWTPSPSLDRVSATNLATTGAPPLRTESFHTYGGCCDAVRAVRQREDFEADARAAAR